jgi:hypothetical protein
MKLKLIYHRQSVGQSVLVSRRPSGTCDQFFFLLEISCRQLRLCYFVAPSLTRGRVCNLLLNCSWALPEQSILSRSPVELTAIFYCLIWDSPNLEGQVPVFISPRNRVAQLYPRAPGCALMNIEDRYPILSWRQKYNCSATQGESYIPRNYRLYHESEEFSPYPHIPLT